MLISSTNRLIIATQIITLIIIALTALTKPDKTIKKHITKAMCIATAYTVDIEL